MNNLISLPASKSSLLVVGAEGPDHLFGGVGRHISEILPRMSERRSTHMVCVPSYCLKHAPTEHSVKRDISSNTITVYDPEHVTHLRTGPFSLSRYDAASDRIAEAVAPLLPDSIGTLLLEDYYDTGLALRLRDRKLIDRFVVFAHLPLSARFSYFDKGADEERQQVLEAAAFLCADRILVPSEAARRTVCNIYPVTPDRVTVLPLASDHIPRDQLELESRPRRVTTIGRFSEQKGWLTYLSVVAQVEAAGVSPTWSLVGDGPLRKTLLERLHQIVPGHRIEWSSFLDPSSELPGLLSRSSLFFLPSAHETFGLAALEAAATGAVPVLVDISAINENWADKAVLFGPGDIQLGAAQICELLTNSKKRAHVANVAWEHAKSFSWGAHLDCLETICFGT